MRIFDFNTKDVRTFIDLEAIQLVSGLTYHEEDYKANCGHGPGSGGIDFGRSEGEFSVTLALREKPIVLTHNGWRQDNSSELEQKVAKALKLAEPTPYEHFWGGKMEKGVRYDIKRHSPEMQKYADYLNQMPNPYERGRAFKAEYERLIREWTLHAESRQAQAQPA